MAVCVMLQSLGCTLYAMCFYESPFDTVYQRGDSVALAVISGNVHIPDTTVLVSHLSLCFSLSLFMYVLSFNTFLPMSFCLIDDSDCSSDELSKTVEHFPVQSKVFATLTFFRSGIPDLLSLFILLCFMLLFLLGRPLQNSASLHHF